MFPVLQQAAAEVGSQQIRNVATVGGNLAQHSRCWYYRHRDTVCLKRGGDLCYARHGENRYHSLFTGNTCISPVVSNLATAFAALDAVAIVLRDGTETRWNMAELYQRAWENPTAQNSLNPGDLLLKVEIPTERRQGAFLQVNYLWLGRICRIRAEALGTHHCEVGHWIGVSWNFSPASRSLMVSHHNPREATQDPDLVAVVAAADQFCVRRGIVLGGVPPELSEPTSHQDQVILQSCLPQLKPGEADKLAEMLESDFLHLIQLMELGAAGLFGGGIPKNPFRECEGST